MTVFGLFIFLAMLIVAGLAVDFMRAEHQRVRFQGTADRAVLAATKLDDRTDNAGAERILDEYMTAEGLSAAVRHRSVTGNRNDQRTMTVDLAARIPTFFARFAGLSHFDLQIGSGAIQDGMPGNSGVRRLEVVLVLDVTGSMQARTANGRTRIENLRDAAEDLVRTLYDGRSPATLSLTIVPYAEHVLMPAGFNFNYTNTSGNGPCVDFVNYSSVRNTFDSPVNLVSCATAA